MCYDINDALQNAFLINCSHSRIWNDFMNAVSDIKNIY